MGGLHEVTRLGRVTRLSILISHFNVITFTWDRWDNPPHVTSPTWGPPSSRKQAREPGALLFPQTPWIGTNLAQSFLAGKTLLRPSPYQFYKRVSLFERKTHPSLGSNLSISMNPDATHISTKEQITQPALNNTRILLAPVCHFSNLFTYIEHVQSNLH